MKVYSRGEVVTFHRLHSNYISKLEFHCMAQKLGYANLVAFYYIKLEFSLDNGLVSFKSDAQLSDMLKFLQKDRLAEVSWKLKEDSVYLRVRWAVQIAC